jgi:hypothetical protein
VTSGRQCEANRRNARFSTGPRTRAGKARAAQNARRHGLTLPTRYDPSRSDEIEALARAIIGGDADADGDRLELARRIAEAQIDLIRARSARRDLFPASSAALLEPGAIARLAAIDRYERRAWWRRKRAIRALDDARTVERAGDFPARLAERSQCELAERSHRKTFRAQTAARQFGRTKPIAAVTGCHRPRRQMVQLRRVGNGSFAVAHAFFVPFGLPLSAKLGTHRLQIAFAWAKSPAVLSLCRYRLGRRFCPPHDAQSAPARSTVCPACAGHDKREIALC